MSQSSTPSPPPFVSAHRQDPTRLSHWKPAHHFSTSQSSATTSYSARSNSPSSGRDWNPTSTAAGATSASALIMKPRSTSTRSRLNDFMHRQCLLLLERYPRCHIVAIPRGSKRPQFTLQTLGARNMDGERAEDDGQLALHQTILYCGQDAEVVIDFIVFDSGRLAVQQDDDFLAWVSPSFERYGSYIFFDQLPPI